MPENFIDPQPLKGENAELNENTENADNERFESDTQKVVRRHLENKDDIITHDDIANVRIGMVPPEFDAGTEPGVTDEKEREEAAKKFINGSGDAGDENRQNKPITPWDTLEPE